MIIATAGHVDHGKTALIRELTGVETDTLEEEKARGLSINLGYAYLPNPGGESLGFIDVPGHQRFINNMIAGISGIDMGLLVIAADDGPMPQTLEHLDVLDILGVASLTVVISKIDRVQPTRVDEVNGQVRALLADRRWTDTCIFPVSSLAGQGVDALKLFLLDSAREQRAKTIAGGFRLSIDRCFVARGAGLVVTGTASAGEVRTGDLLTVLPSGMDARVREVRAQSSAVEAAMSGQRVALNLSGKLSPDDIERGDWLVDPRCARSASRLDVTFTLSSSAPFALKHLAPIKLYLGAKRVAGRLALINSAVRRLQPAERCLAQLILDAPVSAVLGEPFLLRDQAENVTLGGGRVLDPDGPQHGKSRPERLAWLGGLQADSAEASLRSLRDSKQLIDLDRFWAMRNHPEGALTHPVPAGLRCFDSGGKHWAVADSRWEEAVQAISQQVADIHRRQPELPGVKMTALMASLSPKIPATLAMAALVAEVQAEQFTFRDGFVSRKGFRKSASTELQTHWTTLEAYLQRCGPKIPLYSDLKQATRIPENTLKQILKEATRAGELHRLNDSRYALSAQLRHFSTLLIEAQAHGEQLSVTELKARFQSGRKLTIELLEYFDSIRLTKRQGDVRIILDRKVAQQRFGA